MKNQKNSSTISHYKKSIKLLSAILVLFVVSISCSFSADTSSNNDLEKTQIALGTQQTLQAQQANNSLQATLNSQQATIDAQMLQATLINQQPTPDLAATQVSISVQETMNANQAPADTSPVEVPQEQPDRKSVV